jgi:3-phenylpropionate/trans-cinnamate dioxygenase ferredoxin reductase component
LTTDTIVIVGTGQAGGWAAQTLREEGHAGPIVLIGAEPHIPYERPPLSKAVLSGDAAAESTYLIKREAFDQLSLDWRPSVRVAAIDRATKHLRLSVGKPIAYDKLILCTGGRARALQVPGANLPGVLMLRDLDDARTLAQSLITGNRLVVVGGGWIGLEVAATARKKGMRVTVVEAMQRLCERTVPPEISAYLSSLHAAHGTAVVLGAGVEKLSRGAHGTLAVMLSDGRELSCDTVVVGIGLIPNDELAREAGLECDGGVIVDAQCRTSDPNIFAAGDVASWHCAWAGRRMRLESWQNAQEQGIAAARSVLGLKVDHQPLPWFWSDQYDSNVQIYGMPTSSHRVVERRAPGADAFTLFYLDGNVVNAAVGANSARDLRFARRLIEQRKTVDPARLADVQVPMAKL